MRREVREAIEALVAEHGGVQPSTLVAAAQDEESPLHDCFEWDDRVAAYQHRLDQARGLLARVKVTTEVGEERLVHVPVSIVRENDSTTGEGIYKPMSRVVTVEDERARSLRELLAMVRGMNVRVSAFVGAWTGDEEVIRTLRRMDDAARKAEATLEALV